MPTQEIFTVPATEVTATDQLHHRGKLVQVAGVKRGTKNVAICYEVDGARKTTHVPAVATVTVTRDVPTLEEKAEATAKAAAERRHFFQQTLLNNAIAAFTGLNEVKAQMSDALLRETKYVEQAINTIERYAEKVVEADVRWTFYATVLSHCGNLDEDNQAVDIVRAAEVAARGLITQIMASANDTWSGRIRNDIERAKVDAKKAVLRELRGAGINPMKGTGIEVW